MGLLTFDPGNDDASRAEDVHGVEALVFANDGLQDAEQLAQALVDRLVEAVLVLWREDTWCYRVDHTTTCQRHDPERYGLNKRYPNTSPWILKLD